MISWDNPWSSAPTIGSKLRTIPMYVVWLVAGFLSGWVQARRTRALVLGLPALIVAFLVITLGVRSREGLTTETIRRYQEAAEACLRRNQPDQAEFYLNRLKTQRASSDPNLTIQTLIAHQRKRADLAEVALQEMLANSDKSRDAWAHREIALIQLNTTKSIRSSRAEEAISHLETALTLNPDDTQIHELLSRIYLQRGDQESCALHLERVAAVNPAAAIDVARLFERMGRQTRKLEFASKVLSPVENGGAFRGKMAARGIGDRKGWALGELGVWIGSGPGGA